MRPATFRRLMNAWPPFLFSGIVVTRIAPDFRAVDVALKDRIVNRNVQGTHFGGNLFAMTDPFYVLMLRHAMGPGYAIWDKRATIDFRAPGRGTVTASFVLNADDIHRARQGTASGDKLLLDFEARVVDARGALVAVVDKTIYLRRRPEPPSRRGSPSERSG